MFLIKFIFILKICEDDGLPNKICSRCHLDVIQAFSFRKRSQNADTQLKRININKNVTKTEENNSYNYNELESNILNSVECDYKNENDETIDLSELNDKMLGSGEGDGDGGGESSRSGNHVNNQNVGWDMHNNPHNMPQNNLYPDFKVKLEELNFKCPICKKSFPFQSQLMVRFWSLIK